MRRAGHVTAPVTITGAAIKTNPRVRVTVVAITFIAVIRVTWRAIYRNSCTLQRKFHSVGAHLTTDVSASFKSVGFCSNRAPKIETVDSTEGHGTARCGRGSTESAWGTRPSGPSSRLRLAEGVSGATGAVSGRRLVAGRFEFRCLWAETTLWALVRHKVCYGLLLHSFCLFPSQQKHK